MDMRCAGFRTNLAVGVLFGVLCGGATSSGQGAERVEAQRGSGVPGRESREAFARRVFALTDLVLERHIDPPARQEMILGGIKALLVASKKSPAPDLSRRVSDVRTTDELGNLLDEIWPPISRTPVAKGSDSAAAGGSNEQMETAFIRGLLSTVSGRPYIVTAKEARAEAQIQANRYVGLGIALGWDEKAPFPQIQKLIPGGSAELGGMRAGDLIEAIDQAPIVKGSLSLRGVVEKLRGGEGTKVTLRLGRPDSKEVRTITFVRLPTMFRNVSEIKRPVQYGDSARIGLLKIDSVTASTAQELRAFEAKLLSAGAQAVVLDLRNVHDGGPESYHSAVLLADSLLDGKPIGKLRTRERVQEFVADRETLFRDMPLAILVNENTRGAAEWVVGALQRAEPPKPNPKRRIVILGKPTSGSNVVTSAVPLPGNYGVLMLATAVWQPPTADGTNQQPPDPSSDDDDAPGRKWQVVPDQAVDDGPLATTGVIANIPDFVIASIANLARAHNAAASAQKSASKRPEPTAEAPDSTVEAAIAVLGRQLKASGQSAK
jgi:C-terminal processing protease CtpA/Prc